VVFDRFLGGADFQEDAMTHRSAFVRTVLLAIIGLSVTLSAAFAMILAERYSGTLDLTRLNDHTLSPRTRAVLGELDGQHEVLLAGPWSADPVMTLGIEGAELRRALDVIAAMDRASPNLRVTMIDTASASGQSDYRARVADLLSAERSSVERSRALLTRSTQRLLAASTDVSTQARALGELAERSPEQIQSPRGSTTLAGLNESVRATAARLRSLADQIPQLMDGSIAGARAPELDRAASLLRSNLEYARGVCDEVGLWLGEIAQTPGLDADRRVTMRELERSFHAVRDRLAIELDEASRIETPRAILVARLLESSMIGAAIVGPHGIAGIDARQLFPTAGTAGARNADLGRRAEEVIAAGLLAAGAKPAPIVVFVHAEGRSLLESGIVDELRSRLARVGADTQEWDLLRGSARPTRIELDPSGMRPIVWITIGLDVGTRAGGEIGVDRARRLGNAISDLLDDGEQVLVCVAPLDASIFRSGGATDRIAAPLSRFGLRALSTAPLLSDAVDTQGRVWITPAVRGAAPEGQTVSASGTHPVGEAVRGLPIGLRLASPIIEIQPEAPEGVRRWPVVLAGPTAAREREDWALYYRAALAQVEASVQRGGQAQANADVWLDPRSTTGDVRQRGPWTIAWAVEVAGENGKVQRVFVIGAHGWFFDAAANETVVVDARETLATPGNTQLLDSAVAWLAGQDELIAAGPSTRSVSRIVTLGRNERRAIAWGLIGAAPLTVLLAGMVWRLVRG